MKPSAIPQELPFVSEELNPFPLISFDYTSYLKKKFPNLNGNLTDFGKKEFDDSGASLPKSVVLKNENFTNNIYFCDAIAEKLKNSPLNHTDRLFLNRSMDRFMFMPSSCYFQFITSKKQRFVKCKNFCNLNAEILRGIIGFRAAKRIKDILLKAGILETDHQYLKKYKSIGYRLKKEFYDAPWHQKKGTKLRIPAIIGPQGSTHRGIMTFSLRVRVNWAKADYIKSKCMVGKTAWCMEINDLLLDRIACGHIICKIDPKTGRMFTEITNLSKELRVCLEIDGIPLEELDVVSSQPLILATLYEPDCPERAKYLELVENGKFYEEMMIQSGKDPNNDPEGRNRDLTKEATYRYMFGPVNNQKCSGYAKIFQEMFPVMHGILINEKNKGMGHSLVALQMQYIEANVVLGVAAAECIKRKIPIITIHDSFMVKPEDKAAVEETMKRAFHEQLNLNPSIKHKISPVLDLDLLEGESQIANNPSIANRVPGTREELEMLRKAAESTFYNNDIGF